MSTPRGNRGRGGPRGSPGFRGSPRGRGQSPFHRGGGRGSRGRGGKPTYSSLDIIDVDIQQYADVPSGRNSPAYNGAGGRGRGGWRGRGRGSNGNFAVNTHNVLFDTRNIPTRGRGGSGRSTPRGTPRGRGRGTAKNFGQNAPLSRLLDLDRPYLKPVMFVPAQEIPILFRDEEEILEVVHTKEPDSHVPIVEKVEKLFRLPPQDNSFFRAPLDDDIFAVEDSEELMTIDFNAVGSLIAQDQNTRSSSSHKTKLDFEESESVPITSEAAVETVSITQQTTEASSEVVVQCEEKTYKSEISVETSALAETPVDIPVFVLDPNPSAPAVMQQSLDTISIITSTSTNQAPLGSIEFAQDEPDELIVYEAPNPRTGRSTPNLTESSHTPGGSVEASSSRVITQTSNPVDSVSFMSLATRTRTPKRIGRRVKRLTKKERQKLQRRAFAGHGFGDYAAVMEEMHLHEDDGEQRRIHVSDIDWGSESKEEDSHGGMDLDSDLDQNAMSGFVEGMSLNGSQHITLDDVADMQKMEKEDEESSDFESEDDDDESEEKAIPRAIREAEAELVGVELSDSEEDEESEDSDDEEETPNRNFQARLARARKGKGRAAEAETEMYVEKSSSDDDRGVTWADADEDFFDGIQDILDENEELLNSRSRKERKALFNSIRDGDFVSEPITSDSKKDKYRNLPPDLQAQWKQDREKKAENKKKRALARLELAADPFAHHGKGKKARKAMLRAAAMAAEDSDNAFPNQIVDYSSLVVQIRRHVESLGGPSTMALPPMAKEDRAKVHEIADAFGLKSVSKGKGKERYTTLVKTSRTGSKTNEKKIARIMRSAGEFGFTRPGNKGERTARAPRHKEGDEVGKAAPKIGESNVGYKMLATMGWAEGEVIGMSGGLEAPLKAIIKTTKLGLGASTFR